MLLFIPRSLCALKRVAAKAEHARFGATQSSACSRRPCPFGNGRRWRRDARGASCRPRGEHVRRSRDSSKELALLGISPLGEAWHAS